MGNTTQREDQPEAIGSLKLPIIWETEYDLEYPPERENPVPIDSLPSFLLITTAATSDSPQTKIQNTVWNGYGYAVQPAQDDFQKQLWQERGNTALGGYTKDHSKLHVEQSNRNSERMKKKKSGTKVPTLDLAEVQSKQKEDKNSRMPLLPEENENFLKNDHPLMEVLRRHRSKIMGVDLLNKNATIGVKKKKTVTLDEKSVRVMVDEYSDPLDREMADMNDIGAMEAINFAVHSRNLTVNNQDFSIQVRKEVEIAKVAVTKDQDMIKLNTHNFDMFSQRTVTEMANSKTGRKTKRPEKVNRFNFPINDILPFTQEFYSPVSCLVNVGEPLIEFSVCSSEYYTPNFIRVFPLLEDSLEADYLHSIEIAYKNNFFPEDLAPRQSEELLKSKTLFKYKEPNWDFLKKKEDLNLMKDKKQRAWNSWRLIANASEGSDEVSRVVTF